MNTFTPQADPPATSTTPRTRKVALADVPLWFVLVGGAVLSVLLVFVLQNLEDAPVQFLGFEATMPLGIALLLAAIAGGLIVAVAGAARRLHHRKR